MRSRLHTSLGLILGLFSQTLLGQVSVSNIAEYQLGNLPELSPKDLSSMYEQLNLQYRHKRLSLFAKTELFQPSIDEGKSYARLSQFRAAYKSPSLDLEIGNSYPSLGRGLLLRNYSLPSAIYEDRGYRIRYAYDKDLLGLSAKYKSQYFDIKLLRGAVLTVNAPPTLAWEERRPDLVEGGELSGKYKGQSLGLIAMRHRNGEQSDHYSAAYYSGQIKAVNLYAELAKNMKDALYHFQDDAAYGAYVGMNFYYAFVGASLEWKKYQNFAIGNGVNDPPTLIKEQPVRLLNRSTHIPHLNDESGYQVELFFQLKEGQLITVNHAMAKNRLGENDYTFWEYYADYSFSPNTKWHMQLYADYAQDPLMNEKHRYTTGVQMDFYHGKTSSVWRFDVQQIHREIIEKYQFLNLYSAYTFSRAGQFSASLMMEISADPFEKIADEEWVFYPAMSCSYTIDKHNSLMLFAGKRRGGPSCTSGVCYDVLDFQGLEMRLVTRF